MLTHTYRNTETHIYIQKNGKEKTQGQKVTRISERKGKKKEEGIKDKNPNTYSRRRKKYIHTHIYTKKHIHTQTAHQTGEHKKNNGPNKRSK